MEKEEILQWGLIAIASLFILGLVIKLAVASAMSEHNKQARTRTRLLIKKMINQGFSRHEIVEAIHDDNDTFWNKID